MAKSKTVDAAEAAASSPRAVTAPSAEAPTKVQVNGVGIGFSHEVRGEKPEDVLSGAKARCSKSANHGLQIGDTVHCTPEDEASADPTRLLAGEHTQAVGLDDGNTRVISMALEKSADFRTMLGGEGDAPGHDPTLVPRPAESRRLFAGGGPEGGVYVYETKRDNAAVTKELVSRMRDFGYARISDTDVDTLGFLNGQSAHLVRLTRGEGSVLLVTIVEFGDNTNIAAVQGAR